MGFFNIKDIYFGQSKDELSELCIMNHKNHLDSMVPNYFYSFCH